MNFIDKKRGNDLYLTNVFQKEIIMYQLLAILALVFVVNVSVADERGPRIVVEPDQTDIFAIPLDEDSDEEREQIEELERAQRK